MSKKNPIKAFLETNSITQEAFARDLNCSLSRVAKLVAGQNKDIKVSLLLKIHQVTGISYEKLVAWLNS